jgi:LysM repeat protein
MVVRQRWLIHIVLLLLLAFVLAACERPIRPDSGDGGDTPTPGAPINTPTTIPSIVPGGGTTPDAGAVTPDAGGGAIEVTVTPPAEGNTAEPPGEEATTAATPVPPTSPATTAATPAATESSDAGGGVVAQTAVPTPTTGSTVAATPVPPVAGGGQPTAPLPATHTVAAGENLYRIGLRYGISWVTLAQHNGLTNANVLQVGQVLRIPGGGATATPVASPTPSGEVTYVVKAGDNLFRIGQAYNVNWRLIAEANGIVNPNQIYVGQVLKIPTNAPPGPAPQFTHVVRPGETLFLISLRYGVAWPTIAEANNITSPYVIYVGQSLIIPGG